MTNRIVGIRTRACSPLVAALVPALAAVLAGCGAYDSTASTAGAPSVAGARSTKLPNPPAQESPAAQESNLPEIVVIARAPRADGQSIPSYIGKREAMARKARAANGGSNETG